MLLIEMRQHPQTVLLRELLKSARSRSIFKKLNTYLALTSAGVKSIIDTVLFLTNIRI